MSEFVTHFTLNYYRNIKPACTQRKNFSNVIFNAKHNPYTLSKHPNRILFFRKTCALYMEPKMILKSDALLGCWDLKVGTTLLAGERKESHPVSHVKHGQRTVL